MDIENKYVTRINVYTQNNICLDYVNIIYYMLTFELTVLKQHLKV